MRCQHVRKQLPLPEVIAITVMQRELCIYTERRYSWRRKTSVQAFPQKTSPSSRALPVSPVIGSDTRTHVAWLRRSQVAPCTPQRRLPPPLETDFHGPWHAYRRSL